MNNSELDNLLRSARPPERPARYWDQFPERVLANPAVGRVPPRGVPDSAGRVPSRGVPGSFPRTLRLTKLAMGFGLATAAVALIILLAPRLFDFSRSPRATAEKQFACAKKYYEEIVPLFADRLGGIVFDNEGEHLLLNDSPTPPGSLPVYLKICSRRGCVRVITFSGQQILISGELCDVLLGPGGEIIVAGPSFWWSSGAASRPGERYRIEARPLETTG